MPPTATLNSVDAKPLTERPVALEAATTLLSIRLTLLPVVFVVLNNRSYRVLKLNLQQFRQRLGLPDGPYPFMDLNNPPVDFSALARAFGLRAFAADSPAEVPAAVAAAFAEPGPVLVDVRMDGGL